jgi:hypothetical protein
MRFQFTINGEPAGPPLNSPPGANDVHVVWAGGQGGWIEIVILTMDGKPVGVHFPPREANDIDIMWNEEDGLTEAYWTHDGEPIGPIPIPKGANDVHFVIVPLPGGIGPTIVQAWWTQNRKRVMPMPVPKGANDFHLW